MRPPRTAKDDQPGPTGRRHIATGGDVVQSVLICTPATMPSRWGPRNPGHTAPASALSRVPPPEVNGSVAGFLPDLGPDSTMTGFSAAGTGVSATGLTGGGAGGKAPDWATSR